MSFASWWPILCNVKRQRRKVILKRILVTGGAGFIGSHLAERLVSERCHVTVVDNLQGAGGSLSNLSWAKDVSNFDFVEADVRDWATVENLRGVDVVYNQMASKNTVSMDNPLEDLSVNASGTLRLLLASAEAGVRHFVHASTGSVMGELQDTQNEDHPTRPAGFYGVSKLAAESYGRVVNSLSNMGVTSLRYFHVIGPRQDDSPIGGVVPIFIKACEEGRPITIFGTGEQIRSFTSVFDVVEANLLVSSKDESRGKVYNCASGIRVSILELAEYVRSTMHSDVEIINDDSRKGDILDFDVRNDSISALGAKFDKNWQKLVSDVIKSRN